MLTLCPVLREEEVERKAFLEQLLSERKYSLKEMLQEDADEFESQRQRMGGGK